MEYKNLSSNGMMPRKTLIRAAKTSSIAGRLDAIDPQNSDKIMKGTSGNSLKTRETML
jgi:hypothetical protein